MSESFGTRPTDDNVDDTKDLAEPLKPSEINPGEKGEVRSLDFDKYRKLADKHTLGVRKVGLLDKDLAMQSLGDERTLTIETEAGDMPILVPIEYAAGFDAARSAEIAGQHTDGRPGQVLYFCLPPNFLRDDAMKSQALSQLQSLRGTKASIYFDFVEEQPVTQQELVQFLAEAGLPAQEMPLRDERAAEGFQDVTLNFYKTVTHRTEAAPEQLLDTDISGAFDAALADGEFEKYPENGVSIIRPTEMSQELIDQLWDVYEDRFEWLGENHPVSMEESKQDFVDLLFSPNTATSIYFKDGKPVCWTYFMSDEGAEYWLQEDFIKEHIEPETTPLFFPGIVADANNTVGYSEAVLELVAKMVGRMRANFTVMFETTNVSEQYIPRLVKEYVDNTGLVEMSEPTRLDNTRYSLMVVN